MSDPKFRLWDDFATAHHIREAGVPLFATTVDGRTVSAPFGPDKRLVLQRSAEMEDMLIAQAERVVQGLSAGDEDLEGVLYMMHWRDGERIVPLYIGRAGKYGRQEKISANLLNLARDRSKFARWGSLYDYHIGDLSAVACPGHEAKRAKRKYTRWAARLFTDHPSATPLLRRPVFFWAAAWGPYSLSIWQEYGVSSLSFQEYLLIGVASDLFPSVLLNEEGVNKSGPGGRSPTTAKDPG
jgi:hypothetical protein